MRSRILAYLRSLNTHAIANVGLGAGGAVVLAIGALFKALGDPRFLLAIVAEHRQHIFGMTTATLAALLFTVAGATIVAVLTAYLGRPCTVPTGGNPNPEA